MGSDASVLHQLAMRLGMVGTKRFHLEASCHPNGIDAKYFNTGTDFVPTTGGLHGQNRVESAMNLASGPDPLLR